MTLNLALILAAVAILFGGGFYVGRLSVEVPQQKHELAAAAAEVKRTDAAQTVISQEGKKYEDAVMQANAAADAAPAVVCVRRYALVPVATAAPAGRSAHASGGLPTRTPEPIQPTTDIGGAAVAVGARANAQVAGLLDYIQRVCLVH